MIVGPVKGQFGYYVLRVTSITPARQTPLAEARAQIRALLQQQGTQQKMTTFVRDFQDRWRGKTNCRERLRRPAVQERTEPPERPRRPARDRRTAPAPRRSSTHAAQRTAPAREREPAGDDEALLRLDELTRRLRRECPWDREQDERTIVPHTLEEAYELADAAHRRDDAKLLDELGDVLFQVHFLSLLLEERGAGDLARGRRALPPEADPPPSARLRRGRGRETPAEVLRNWDEIKKGEEGREPGVFGEVPENLPSLLHARKVQRRAASSGFDFPGVEGPLQSVRDELDELEAVADAEGDAARDERFHELGDVLFAAVNVARKLKVDPELALRAASERFRGRVEAGVDLAAREGRTWDDLTPDEQLTFYARGRMLHDAASPRPGEPSE